MEPEKNTPLNMPTSNPKTDLFKPAADLWDLERLYADLATVKGEDLSETEALHLRGLLCGYSSSAIANKLHRSVRGTQADISSHINQSVKELVNQRRPASKQVKNLNSAGDIRELLEELEYRKRSSIFMEGTMIQIETAIGNSITQINKLGDRVSIKMNNSPVSISFPTEVAKQLSEALAKVLANSFEGGGGGKKGEEG
jgi:hypothetical protein